MDLYLRVLIGELIGLARATDGNEHLITPESTLLLRECLSSRPSDSCQLQILLNKVAAVKQKMVPDCFFCANPCGRTSAFDLSELQTESDAVQAVKAQIIKALLNMDSRTPDTSIYRGLIALGMADLSEAFLHTILLELSSPK